MLNILILSQQGDGYGLACKLKQEGHIVKFWNSTNTTIAAVGTNNRPQEVNRYEEHVEAADLVIDASSRFGSICQSLRDGGKVVLGGAVQELLVWDEEYATNTIEGLLGLPRTNSLDGQVVTFYGFFNGKEWLGTYHSQEHIRLLDGDRGPRTFSVGSVVWQAPTPMEELDRLLAMTHTSGVFALRVVVCPEGVSGLSFQNPFSSSALAAISEYYGNSLGYMLYATANTKSFESRLSNQVSVAVQLLAMNDEAKVNVNPQAEKHFMWDANPNVLGYVTACGEDTREARRRVYRSVNNIANLDVVYRSDIGLKGETLCR